MAIIGISANIEEAKKRILYQDKSLFLAESSIVEKVEKLGHTAIILPIHQDIEKSTSTLINIIDALILSGGSDVDPSSYNEALLNEKWKGQIQRDKFEIKLIEKAKEKNIPILGICRGLQIMNVAYKGTLYQDLLIYRENTIKHRDQEMYDNLYHKTEIIKDTPLFELFNSEMIITNSVHHQGIKDLGEGLEIMAYSEDGVIEAIRDPKYDFVWGIQWHPEWSKDLIQENLFNKLFENINK
ncbi:MAG: gamma-glutamyl-gamma-aminobutyrate hydrolase family protein [Candidatus Sericytochromatia bacterium]